MHTTLVIRQTHLSRAALFAALFALTTFCGAQPRRVLPLPALQAWAKLTPQERMPADMQLQLTLSLPLRNRERLTNLLEQLYDPASPNYHRYLAVAQFAEKFGPTEQDYEKVIQYAKARGLKIRERHSNRMLITVSAAAGEVEQAFGVKLQRYQHPTEGRTFFGPDAEPTVEGDVPLLEVEGLDDYVTPQSLGGSGGSGSYLGNDYRNAYVPDVTLTGAGQYVGVFSFAPYWTSDIEYYKTLAGRTNLVVSVPVNGFNTTPTTNDSTGEVSVDIEQVISMAPGATVYVYEGSSASAILNKMATDNICKSFTSSYNWTLTTTVNQILQQFALQGQSISMASGDHNAHVGAVPGPEDSPYITIVGGTVLSTASANGPWTSETVWHSTSYGSSGGVSPTYALPVWQQGLNMAANGGSTTMRNCPDVAMIATGVYGRYGNGKETYNDTGTSFSSPLWAGFVALVNEQAAASGQSPVGFVNPAIYAIGRSPNYALCFHDITTSNNTRTNSTDKYFAVPGYDLCTGWGTPNGSNLITALLQPPANQATPIYQTVQSGNWNAANAWQASYGGSWVEASNAPDNTFSAALSGSNALTVSVTNGVTVNVTNTVNASRVAVYGGSTLAVGGTGAFVIVAGGGTDLDVFGVVSNSGSFGSFSNSGPYSSVSPATLVFEPGSVYQHAQNSGVLPLATWASNATCQITGWATSTSVLTNMGLDQTLGNLTWNSPGQTAAASLGNDPLETVAGNLVIQSTGSGSVKLVNNGSATNIIYGDLRVQGGTLNLCGGSGTLAVNLNGNLALTGGNFTSSGSTYAAVNFVKAGTQILTNKGVISSSGKIHWSVGAGTTLDLGTNVIAGTGSFTLAAGGGLICANPGGLDGSLAVTGSKSLSNGGNYTFNGMTAQATGSLLPGVANNFTLSNLAGVTLGSSLTVNGTLGLAYANDRPALAVSNGTLTLSNNPIQLTIAAAVPLTVGSYKLVSQDAGGSVVGDVSASSVVVGGGGMVGGTIPTAVINGGELYLVVNSVGHADSIQVASGTAGITFIAVSNLSYQIQRATNLTFTGGTRLWSTNVPPSGVFQLVDDFSDLGGQPQGAYYRLLYTP